MFCGYVSLSVVNLTMSRQPLIAQSYRTPHGLNQPCDESVAQGPQNGVQGVESRAELAPWRATIGQLNTTLVLRICWP